MDAVEKTKTSPKMRAFSVLETTEDTGGIVFSRHAVSARREGASQFGDGDFFGVTCRRAPWADAYADLEEDIPARLMIEHGWNFECTGCGERISEHWLECEGLPVEGVIGSQHSAIFCCDSCRARHAAVETLKKEAKDEYLGRLRAIVLKRFPGVRFVTGEFREHAYVEHHDGVCVVEQAFVSFEFPGMKLGPATYRVDQYQRGGRHGPPELVLTVCRGDLEAFESWAGTSAKD